VRSLLYAPVGKTYEAWVIQGDKPAPTGTFAGGGRVAFALSRKVPDGAIVAVTLERAGGVERPTTKPLFASEPV
jgi:anti-sigma-K factor RskA